ncbi:MAG: hypothetical protein ACREMW_13695 [Gemmatimonadales bacterium]
MKRICCFAVTVLLPLGAPAAQETLTLAPGSRVRVTIPHQRVVGTLESIDSTTIVVRRQNGSVVTLERAGRTRLDVSAGPGSCSPGRRGGCIALGFLGGAGVGFGVGAIVVSSCDGDLCGLYYLITVPAGAVVGTVVGAVVGGEHWKQAEIPVRLTFAPGGSGDATRVGVRIRF